MRIEIYSQQFNLTQSLQSYLHTKLHKLERHFDQHCEVHVRLAQEKPAKRVLATAILSGQTLHTNADGPTMYAAIDKMVHRLDRLVLKYKEKKTNHHPHLRRHDLH